MLTVIESPLFSRLWPDYWTVDEHGEFVAWLAAHPLSGDVVPGSGGVRKLRWSRAGSGKRGGVRVIYAAHPRRGLLLLLTLYAKARETAIPAHILKALHKEMNDAND